MKTSQFYFKLVLFVYIGFLSNTAYCATYYVRPDGGTPTQCTGTVNAPYPGSGNGQACSFNHPAWVLGTYGNSGIMVGGDTLIIGNTNPTTGGQAQYMIGYGMPNTVNANCNLFSPYDCTLNPIPSGPNASNPTKILGLTYNNNPNPCSQKPQLWGTESVKQVLNVTGSNIDIECLEITDHSNCGFRVGSPLCSDNYNGNSNGTYARNGVFGGSGSSNLTFRYVDVHGLSNRGFLLGGVNGVTFSYVNMDGNYMSNWDGDVGEAPGVSYNSGTILLDHVKNRFAGCSESYPRSAQFNTADYSNCTDQNDNPPGYGDGIGMYNTGGSWIITDSEFSHNTQDGLDLLYHDGTGAVTIQRSLFEGNDGNQLKITSPQINVENSIVIGNCNYHMTNNKVKNRSTWTSCRAGGDALVYSVGQGGSYKITNSTIYSDGNSDLLLVNRLGTCNGSERYTFRNNINVGNSSTAALYINDLGGSCATPALDTDYSIVYNVTNSFCPSGAHNRCSTNPRWTAPINQTADSNLANVAIQSNSPAIGAGVVISGISTLDYSNKERGNTSWDIGALQYSTSGTVGGTGTGTGTGGITEYPPVVNITAPLNQSSFTEGANITISATASEVNGTISRVYFYNGSTLLGSSAGPQYNYIWNNVPAGTYTLTAQATDVRSVSTISDPITINVSSTSNPTTISLVTPLNNAVYNNGPVSVTLRANVTAAAGTTITKVEFFNGTARLNYTGTSAPYTYTWNNVLPGTYPALTAQITDSNGTLTTSTPVSITVNQASANVPTTVNLTSPINNAVYIGPASVPLAANVSPATGSTITKVEFFNGTARLNYTGTSAPYTYTWNNVLPGTYPALTAQVTDSNGTLTTSAPVSITVNQPSTNEPTSVTLTSPTNNAVYIGPANVTLTANVTAATGTTISKVEFFNDTVPLNYIGTSSPYTYTWNNVLPGAYPNLTARVTDSSGTVTTSNPIGITVNQASANVQTAINISTPTNNAVYTGPVNIPLAANVTAATGTTISKVEFFNGSARLNYTGTVSPYIYTWNNVQPGVYPSITAQVTDSSGSIVTSNPISIVVNTAGENTTPPTVNLTMPENNAQFNGPASVALLATALAAPGSYITKVEFFNGTARLNYTGITAPYSYTWNNVQPGTYTLTAQATANNGTVSTSAPVTIDVSSGSSINTLIQQATPVVSITIADNQSVFTEGSDVSIIANAFEVNGSISRVYFYNGTNLLGSIAGGGEALNFTWSNVTAGSYTLSAQATDTRGISASSNFIPILVNTAAPSNLLNRAPTPPSTGGTNSSPTVPIDTTSVLVSSNSNNTNSNSIIVNNNSTQNPSSSSSTSSNTTSNNSNEPNRHNPWYSWRNN